MASALHSFARDTNQDMLLLVGTPRKEYGLLKGSCRICWVYETEWDELTEYVRYDSVNDAVEMLSKYEDNICGTTEWLKYAEEHSLSVCILNDVTISCAKHRYIELDKFIICTNNPNHVLLNETASSTETINLRTSNINSIINVLKDPPSIEYTYIISSQSLLPYAWIYFSPVI